MSEPESEPRLPSFGARFRELATEAPDRVALWFAATDGSTREITWAALDDRSNQLARAFAADGLGFGDRVAVELHNSPELVEAIVAAWKLGAVPVPVRWDLPAWERERVLEVVDAKLVVSTPVDVTGFEASPLPDVTGAQTHGICSSGSTGLPKVIVTERPASYDPAGHVPFPSGWGEVPRPQVILVPGPMYHTNGFATLLSLVAGDSLVLLERFDAARVVDLVEALAVTTFTATTTMLQRIADLPDVDGRDLTSLSWVLQGAAVISPALVRRWIDLVGAERFFMAYGMTEGLGLTALRGDEWLAHPGTVGRGYRDTEIRILAPDTGELLPAGEIGEIYLRSPTSGMYRYLGGAPLLASTDDGFATAGDMGYLDEDGFLHILDRRVDLIITGGANVFPAEVESALIEHPAVADVVVVGLADPEWGRRVHAIVEPATGVDPPTADDVIAYAKARLAAYKVPKTVELIDVMPRTAATKVNRAALVAERGG
jgi:bile acid-coenzyme A ligase